MNHADTIVALATPRGESAVALIRLSGGDCAMLSATLFGRKSAPVARRATLGLYRNGAGEVIDQCLFTYFEAGASYTGEASLEIIPHGNPLVVRMILADLVARGCRQADPGEFTRRAFLNDKLDLTEAEAVADLIHARSERALSVARKQLAGDLGRRVSDWSDQLLQVVAELEAYIDFPEEDLPLEDDAAPPARARALALEWERAALTADRHAALSGGIRTVILGAPNAGKSSLLNALLGEERALVSAEPGTTRDFISETVTVGPHSLRLVDTAGIRSDYASEIERRGIERSREKAAEADFCIVVLDGASPPPEFPPEVTAYVRPESAMVVFNKADLVQNSETSALFPEVPRVSVCLLTGDGLSELKNRLVELLERDGLAPGEDELVVNARHADALRGGAAALRRADTLLRRDDRPAELAVGEMRLALDSLGEIVGRIDNERMLDRLFATFCIGK